MKRAVVVKYVLGVLGLAVLLAVLLAAGSGCSRVSSAAAPEPTVSAEPTVVTTVYPERRTIQRTIEQPGQIEGYAQTPLYAKIPGYVSKLHVDIGDRVKEGQLLAELSVPETVEEHRQKQAAVVQGRAEVVQAKRLLAVAEATVKKAEAALQLAKAGRARAQSSVIRWRAEDNRVRRLVRNRAGTQEEREQTIDQLRSAETALAESNATIETAEAARVESVAQRDRAVADITVAEARLRVAEADERRLAALVAYAQIRAPFDGVVSKRLVDVGQLLQPSGAQPESGRPLFVVVRTDPVRIFVDVPEGDAPLVRPGSTARVMVQALQEREFTGRVTRFSWVLDTQTRTLRTQIDLPNADGLLRPGMYAKAHVLAEQPGTLTVPSEAVIYRDDESFVVRVENGRAVLTPVRLGRRQGQWVEVLKKQVRPAEGNGRRLWESFSGTEQVVASNPAALAEGQQVVSKALVRRR
jgi:multidrug efflux pump subunit AcrA (membrane-fusion protein)